MKTKHFLLLLLVLLATFITSCSNAANHDVQAYANNITQNEQANINFQVINQQSPDSEDLTINYIYEDNEKYIISVKYPATYYQTINKSIEDLIYPYINNYKEILKSNTTYSNKLELLIDYETIKYNDSIITFKFNIYSFVDSKTQINVIKTLTFNLDNGKTIFLENLFTYNTNYLEKLSQNANKFLDTNIAPIKESYSSFALSQNNLIIYFDINRAAEASDTLKIPYSELSDILLEFDQIGVLTQSTPIETTQAQTQPSTAAVTEATPETTVPPSEPVTQPTVETSTQAQVSDEKWIALTFDDGPNPKTTPILLDGLKERNVKATFFVLGVNIENNPDLIKRMFDEGQLIANHSYSHQNLVKISNDNIKIQYDKPNTLLNSLVGVRTTLFRPPYGNYNDSVKKYTDTPIILWSIDPKDWKYKDADGVSNHIIERAKDGDIILLHDIYPTSVQAALKTIDALQQKGFHFVTVDELIRRDGYEPKASEVFRFKRK